MGLRLRLVLGFGFEFGLVLGLELGLGLGFGLGLDQPVLDVDEDVAPRAVVAHESVQRVALRHPLDETWVGLGSGLGFRVRLRV